MYKQMFLSYTQWKATRTTLGLTTYYIQEESRYIPFIVDVARESVYRTEVMRDPWTTASANLTDFQTNIKAGATVVNSIDDGIGKKVT